MATLHLTPRRPRRTALATNFSRDDLGTFSVTGPSTFLGIVPFARRRGVRRSNLDRGRERSKRRAQLLSIASAKKTKRRRGVVVSFAPVLGQPLAIPGLFLCRVSNGHVSIFPVLSRPPRLHAANSFVSNHSPVQPFMESLADRSPRSVKNFRRRRIYQCAEDTVCDCRGDRTLHCVLPESRD